MCGEKLDKQLNLGITPIFLDIYNTLCYGFSGINFLFATGRFRKLTKELRRTMKRILLIVAIAVATCYSSQNALAATWAVPGDFPTIQQAHDASINGDKVQVGPGSHAGATLTKSLAITGEDGATINSGPMHPAGLSQGFRLEAGSDGVTVSHLKFEVDLAIMNGAGVDFVTIDHCTFANPIQGISNWRGSGWQISHNNVNGLRTRNGGGIGILNADFSGGIVEDNVVSHNKITGTLVSPDSELGGYAGSGIVIFADYRWGRTGAERIAFNRVVKNHVSIVSTNPSLVDVVAFELTDTRDAAADPAVIINNAIGFNDFRGTVNQIALTPESLDTVNSISRNLGENRGRGSHPSVFGPGGM